MRTPEERYAFLLSHLRVVDVDRWEGDGILEMDNLYFGFSVDRDIDKLDNIEAVIDFAIEAKEWDAKHLDENGKLK